MKPCLVLVDTNFPPPSSLVSPQHYDMPQSNHLTHGARKDHCIANILLRLAFTSLHTLSVHIFFFFLSPSSVTQVDSLKPVMVGAFTP